MPALRPGQSVVGDTAENWTNINPILQKGIIGVEHDTGKGKIGDGVSHWADLVYVIQEYVPSAAKQTTGDMDIYVDKAATGANDGTSWTDAFTTIQAALDSIPYSVRDNVYVYIRRGDYRSEGTLYLNVLANNGWIEIYGEDNHSNVIWSPGANTTAGRVYTDDTSMFEIGDIISGAHWDGYNITEGFTSTITDIVDDEYLVIGYTGAIVDGDWSVWAPPVKVAGLAFDGVYGALYQVCVDNNTVSDRFYIFNTPYFEMYYCISDAYTVITGKEEYLCLCSYSSYLIIGTSDMGLDSVITTGNVYFSGGLGWATGLNSTTAQCRVECGQYMDISDSTISSLRVFHESAVTIEDCTITSSTIEEPYHIHHPVTYPSAGLLLYKKDSDSTIAGHATIEVDMYGNINIPHGREYKVDGANHRHEQLWDDTTDNILVNVDHCYNRALLTLYDEYLTMYPCVTFNVDIDEDSDYASINLVTGASGKIFINEDSIDSLYLAIDGTADNSLLLNGATAASFATAGHNHDAVYLALDATADNSLALGGTNSSGWSLATHNHNSTYPTIETGTAAPSSTPSKVGDMYVDTSNKKLYFAVGTSSSSDWEIAN